ncbi:MAG: gliding motility-associated C-terminal domain-containing protein, partial [Flavobacteriales bacterium]|nr:gliding motility-associated C-terminal domain-containing protein [Flavobacteriales bacterium]
VNDALAFTNDPNIRGSVVILNRWGNVVYESDDLTKKWNGKSQSGIDVIEGVYFYKIEYVLNATYKPKSGFVSVVR